LPQAIQVISLQHINKKNGSCYIHFPSLCLSTFPFQFVFSKMSSLQKMHFPINILASFPLRAFFFPCLESNWVLETILLPKQLPFVVVLAHQLDASSAQLLAKATLFYIIKLIKITYNYFKMFVTHKHISLR